MYRVLLIVCLLSGCDVFRGGDPRPRTKLSEREFIEVYVALAQVATPEEKARVLKRHGTSQQELQAFVRAYSRNLNALSTVFDSIVARQGVHAEPQFRSLPKP
jgi:hypothetical protein